MVSTAHSAAEQLDACVSIAVVDAGGQLIAFARMSGAEIVGLVLAKDKAYTAVAHRTETGSCSIPSHSTLDRPGQAGWPALALVYFTRFIQMYFDPALPQQLGGSVIAGCHYDDSW